MKIPFRQGIVRYQTDISNSPNFLYRETSGNHISLYVSPTSTIVTFAHGDMDYLLEESRTITNAWGPFTPGVDYYLYWDINLVTGARAFGHTRVPPTYGAVRPAHPAVNHHWFDTTSTTMFYWSGQRWVECIRVFAGKYLQGANLIENVIGSQVSINTLTNAGYLLFDDNEKPIRRARLDGKGKFLTTESQFYTAKAATTTVSFETIMHYAEASQDLTAWSVVSYTGADSVGLASSSNSDNVPAFGIVREALSRGALGAIVTRGFVTNVSWDWSDPASTPLFLGELGALQTTPPGTGFIQQIATIVSPDTIFINIEPQIVHYGSTTGGITMPVEIDLTSGKLSTAPSVSGNGNSGGSALPGVGLAAAGDTLYVPPNGITNSMILNERFLLDADDASSGYVDLGGTLAILGTPAQGISTALTSGTITITAINASTTQKGVASFNPNFFTVASGVVDLDATLDDLTNVSLTDSATTDSILTKTAGDWQPITRATLLGTESINSLSDVIITSAASGDTLINDGTNWINQKVSFVSTQSSSTTWTITHNIGQKYVNVTIYDNTDNVIIPLSIVATSANVTTVTFDVPVAGTAVISR